MVYPTACKDLAVVGKDCMVTRGDLSYPTLPGFLRPGLCRKGLSSEGKAGGDSYLLFISFLYLCYLKHNVDWVPFNHLEMLCFI